MARCSSTGKFEPEALCEEPEEQDLQVDEDGGVWAEVRIWKECEGCGSEAKELTFSLEGQVDDEGDPETETVEAHKAKCDQFDLSIESGGWEVTERTQTKDRHGKQIKSYRYMRQFYGVTGTHEVKCACGYTWSVTLADEDMASSFEDTGH